MSGLTILTCQCSIPAFEGLFPPDHDDIIRILLFRLCEWHVLAKLRLHSNNSLALLDEALKKLGTQIRKFQEKTCEVFKTYELPSEAAAQQRRQQAQAELGRQVKLTSSTVRPKKFNTLTYKFHALGDYTRTIRMFGTTDSYTMQIVSRLYYMMYYFSTNSFSKGECAHRVVKKFYRHTNKKDVAMGITKYERRVTRIQQQLDSLAAEATVPTAEISDDSSPELHHVMRPLPCNVFNLAKFLSENRSDPAVKVGKGFFGFSDSYSPQGFIPRMKDHLLSRLLGYEYDGDECAFTDDERNDLRIIGGLNRAIQSNVLCINYTTYDIRRGQDVLRPGPKCFVFTLS